MAEVPPSISASSAGTGSFARSASTACTPDTLVGKQDVADAENNDTLRH